MGSSDNGKKICTGIAAYMVIKSVINLVLGFSLGNCVWLIVNIWLGICLILAVKKYDFSVAVFLALMFLLNVKANIGGRQWFYLGEGIIDVICAVTLCISKDVKAFFED